MVQSVAATVGIVDGTSTNDKIKGRYKDGDGDRVSKGADVISAGAGNDFVNAGKGDDTMIYTSGNDTYVGGKGFDTLDLSKYDSDEVTFSIKGKHVLIETPDGTITLKNQNKKKLDTGKVMEEIVFADGTLDEAGIKARAKTDGTLTPGVVTGTILSEVIDATYTGDPDGEMITDDGNIISSGAGSDKVFAGAGDDTFIYTSGGDTYHTGAGYDILDLSKYDLADITVRFQGHRMEIKTPDGFVYVTDQGKNGTYNADGTVNFDGTIGFEEFVFADQTMTEAEFNAFAISSQGTDGNDSIYGADNTAGVFNSGAGNDRLFGGKMDDVFIYTSGNDTISTGGGNDTLDLSKYSLDEVTFFASNEIGHVGHILTPDGLITIDWDYYGKVTHDVVFSDVSLSSEEVEDQMNLVFGSYQSEIVDADFTVFAGGNGNRVGEGNDTIASEGGDDVVYGYGGDDSFIYRSGNDTYIGGEGDDILFIGDHIYWIEEVIVTQVGNTDSMLISFDSGPGNSITIVGGMDVNSEDTIETFIFGNQVFTQQDMIDMIA